MSSWVVVLSLAVVVLLVAQVLLIGRGRRSSGGLVRGFVLRPLGWLATAVVFAVVVVPLAVVLLVARLLPGRRGDLPAGDWVARSAPVSPASWRRPSCPATDTGPRVEVRTPLPLKLLTAAVVVLVVDLALGAVLSGSGLLPGAHGAEGRAMEDRVDALVAAPALAEEPWAADYRDELVGFERRRPSYEPFIITGNVSYRSQYINTDEDGRRTYRPAAAAGGRPLRVAVLGGATAWGEGQRDDHTIPSELARIAENDGVALQVDNLGHPGWVAWQELQLLERRLADGQQYDLAVFLDGEDEVAAQQGDPSPDPTHEGAALLRQLGADFHTTHYGHPGVLSDVDDVVAAYRRASGALRVIDAVGDTALADPEADQRRAPAPISDEEAPSRAVAADATEIYGRAASLIDDLSAQYDTPVARFWQPRRDGWDPALTDALPTGTTDLGAAAAGWPEGTFLSEYDLSEAGAHLAAQAIWDEVAATLDSAGADPMGPRREREEGGP